MLLDLDIVYTGDRTHDCWRATLSIQHEGGSNCRVSTGASPAEAASTAMRTLLEDVDLVATISVGSDRSKAGVVAR